MCGSGDDDDDDADVAGRLLGVPSNLNVCFPVSRCSGGSDRKSGAENDA